MKQYRARACEFCGGMFNPITSRQKHCCWECRFLGLTSRFNGVDGCWEWPLSCNKQTGYGQFNPTSTHLRAAHRVSYEMFNGLIPEGRLVCHYCDNRKCFNPAHLFLGSHRDNTNDMISKGRWGDKNMVKGEAHHNAVLTTEVVAMIRTSPLSARRLASTLGVNKSTVLRARRGDTWS